METCIKCKRELPEGAAYCPACGKKQQTAPRKTKKRVNGSGTVYKMAGKRTKPWAAQKNSKRSTTGTSLFFSSCATIDVARKT